MEKLPDDVSREFPFVSTRKSALHLRVLDRLAEDLLEGKDFANTASDVFQVTCYPSCLGHNLIAMRNAEVDGKLSSRSFAS